MGHRIDSDPKNGVYGRRFNHPRWMGDFGC